MLLVAMPGIRRRRASGWLQRQRADQRCRRRRGAGRALVADPERAGAAHVAEDPGAVARAGREDARTARIVAPDDPELVRVAGTRVGQALDERDALVECGGDD